MSATLSGLDMLRRWLDTEIYECQFRPVPLSEYIQVAHKLTTMEGKILLDFPQLQKALPQDVQMGLFGQRNDGDYVSQ